MISLITTAKAQMKLAENVRDRRLSMELTQEGLAIRSAVPLPTLRKFEQKGIISLQAFLKLIFVVGGLDEIIAATTAKKTTYSSIDEVLKETPTRKRGRKK